MTTLGNVLVALIVMLHIAFLVLEMFFWTKPIGLKFFEQTPQEAEATAALAANQGLYNGFIAAGLIFALALAEPTASHAKVFVLFCVLIAGLYGGITVKSKILLWQALPAAIALFCFWVG